MGCPARQSPAAIAAAAWRTWIMNEPQAALAGRSANADRRAVDCDHGKVTARSGPALLFHLFYQVEIRRRQLPQRQSCTRLTSTDPTRIRCECGNCMVPMLRIFASIGAAARRNRTRPRDTMTTVIGSLKMARGFFAAHSRCTTETIANCSCERL